MPLYLVKLSSANFLLAFLILMWLGFLGIRFEVGAGRNPPPPQPPQLSHPPLLCLKLVRIMLETSNLARKYTLICSFRKDTF